MRGSLCARTGVVAAAALTAAIGVLFTGPAGAASSPVTMSVSAVLPTPAAPEGLAVDPERGLVFVAAGSGAESAESPEAGDGTEPPDTAASISIYNRTTHALLGAVGLPSDAEFLAYDIEHKKLYVPNADAGATIAEDLQLVSVIDVSDPAHPAVVKTIEMPVDEASPSGNHYQPDGVALDPENGVLYVTGSTPEPPCAVESEPPEDDVEAECETPGQGAIIAIDAVKDELITGGIFLAGDDPEAIVFNQQDHRVYAANEDDGTVTMLNAVKRTAGSSFSLPSSSVKSRMVFTGTCPTPDAGATFGGYNEADKMAVDQTTGTVYLTDDLWRVAAIPKDWDGSSSLTVETIGSCKAGGSGPIYTNNVAVDDTWGPSDDDGIPHGIVYVTSEQNTIAVLEGETLDLIATFTVPASRHLDAIGVDSSSHDVFVSDEDANMVSILGFTGLPLPAKVVKVRSDEVANSFLCWNREMVDPVAYVDKVADEMWQTGKYIEPQAILGNVPGGSNLGAYHLVCNAKAPLVQTDMTLGGSGEVYDAQVTALYHAEHPGGNNLNVYHIWK